MRAHAHVPSNGNAHNQLAVLRTYVDDDFGAMYHYFRAILVATPFQTASSNVSNLLDKVILRSKERKPRPPPAANVPPLLTHSNSLVLLHAYLFSGRLEEFQEAIGPFMESFASHIALVDICDVTANHLMHMLVCCFFYVFHAAQTGSSFVVPASCPDAFLLGHPFSEHAKDISRCAFLWSQSLISVLADSYRTSGANLLMPLSVGVCWLRACAALPETDSQQASPLRIAMERLRSICSSHQTPHQAAPLPEDFDLAGFLPMEAHLKFLNFNLPRVTDSDAISVARKARIASAYVQWVFLGVPPT